MLASRSTEVPGSRGVANCTNSSIWYAGSAMCHGAKIGIARCRDVYSPPSRELGGSIAGISYSTAHEIVAAAVQAQRADTCSVSGNAAIDRKII